jgi:hypothetical protein
MTHASHFATVFNRKTHDFNQKLTTNGRMQRNQGKKRCVRKLCGQLEHPNLAHIFE